MTTPLPQERIKELTKKVEDREKKIDDVRERIRRQEDHIRRTERKKLRFQGHLDRWIYQNERDRKEIQRLKDEVEKAIKGADALGTPMAG